MTNIKNEMTDEMLDAVTGGAGFYIVEPGEKPNTYNIIAVDGTYETAKHISGIGFSKVKASGSVSLYGEISDLGGFKQYLKDHGFEPLKP